MKNQDVYFSLSRALFEGFSSIYGVVAHYEATRIKRQERIALWDDVSTESCVTDIQNLHNDFMRIENDIILVMQKTLQDELHRTPADSNKNERMQRLLDRITDGIVKRPADALVLSDYFTNPTW